MSIYARNFTVDENTGEAKLIKHLNQLRIDRGRFNRTPGGNNKSGASSRLKKRYEKGNKKEAFQSFKKAQDSDLE